jgi:hypothetical protein
MNNPFMLGVFWLASLSLISVSTEAELIDRGGGLVYDDVLNITWLTDANYQATELNDARVAEIVANNTLVFNDGHVLSATDFDLELDAIMNWWGAMAWVDQLEYYDPVRQVTYRDWRLPMVSPIGSAFDTNFSNNGTTDFGYGFTTADSEMAHLYYMTLGNLGVCIPNGDGTSTSCKQQPGWGLSNSGPFVNLNTQTYWSNSKYADSVWAFDFGTGFQGLKTSSNKNNYLRVFAVRTGDVAAHTNNAADILIATRIILGIHIATQTQKRLMDVAPLVGGISMPDGALNVGDLILIQRNALGLLNF